jgi:hypothetical protein
LIDRWANRSFLPRPSIGSWLSVVLILDFAVGSGCGAIVDPGSAGVWFVVFGIGLFIAGCCFCCCPSGAGGGGSDSYSRACLFVSLALLFVVTAAAASLITSIAIQLINSSPIS